MLAKAELIEHIEVTAVELKQIAQPLDLAELSTLLLDARETEDPTQLEAIQRQVDNLRRFCESRRQSSATMFVASLNQAPASRRVAT